MKKILAIAFVSTLLVQVHAQKRVRDFSLAPPTGTVETSLYQHIDVIDGRDFKENLGIIQVGALNAKAQVIPEIPLEKQIQQQLGLLVQGSTGDGTLVLLIKKFTVAELTGAFSESGFFDFRAELFVKDQFNSYQKLASIDTSHVNKGMDVTKGLLRHASWIVTDFLKDNLNKLPSDTTRYNIAQISDFENMEKAKTPLYQNAVLKDGIYTDYRHFKNQMPDGEATLKDQDPAKGFYTLDAKGKLKRIKANSCYAVVFNGMAYISSENNFYPLFREGHDFFFQGPSRATASATNVVAASVMFGALGAVLASNNVEYYLTKIDFYNGSFIKISKL